MNGLFDSVVWIVILGDGDELKINERTRNQPRTIRKK